MRNKYLILKQSDAALEWSFSENRPNSEFLLELPLTQVQVYSSSNLRDGHCLDDHDQAGAQEARILCELIGALFPRVEQKIENHFNLFPFLNPQFTGIDENREWVFYGGTFSPWHKGHQACLDLMPKDKKLVIVPDRSPWKEGATALNWSSVWNLGLWASKRGHALYPGFLALEKTNPTVEWLPLVKGKKSLLIGEDNFLKIHQWKNFEKLLQSLTRLYVAPREYDFTPEFSQQEQLSRLRKLGVEIQILDHHDFEHLSSTAMRNQK